MAVKTVLMCACVCLVCLVPGERLGHLPSQDSQDDFSSSSLNGKRSLYITWQSALDSGFRFVQTVVLMSNLGPVIVPGVT